MLWEELCLKQQTKASIQYKVLNSSKGPAVRGPSVKLIEHYIKRQLNKI